MTLDFERIPVGHGYSGVHVFNPSEVSAFATAAGDINPLHHDAISAGKSVMVLIVSGTHTSSLLMG